MKDNLLAIKKKFDDRCEEFKRQVTEFKNNNEAIDALKKAHAKELASHVQAHNKQYNELLQDKMDSEDALKEQAAKEKADVIEQWKQKLNKAVEETKKAMETQFATKLKDVRATYDNQIQSQHNTIELLNEEIGGLQAELKKQSLIMQGKDEDIAKRNGTIQDLEA